ncbi:MAG: A24 family peptidase [Desulfovibrio sp.]|nr:A24 family peptidase [Desulfovibrio sp.]
MLKSSALLMPGLSLLWLALFALLRTPEPETFALCRFGLYTLLGTIAICAAIIDLKTEILPDCLTLYATLPCLAALLLVNGLWAQAQAFPLSLSGMLTLSEPLLGSLVGFVILKGLQLILRKKSGKEELGSGDSKLMLALGALTGPANVLPTLILAVLLLFPFFLLVKKRRLPFGPALVCSAVILVLGNFHLS